MGVTKSSSQGAIYKARTSFTTISFGYFDGFVDNDFGRCLGFDQELINCLSEDSKVNFVYLGNRPLWGTFLDNFVDLSQVCIDFGHSARRFFLFGKTSSKK